jgi:hypothetical protein
MREGGTTATVQWTQGGVGTAIEARPLTNNGTHLLRAKRKQMLTRALESGRHKLVNVWICANYCTRSLLTISRQPAAASFERPSCSASVEPPVNMREC